MLSSRENSSVWLAFRMADSDADRKQVAESYGESPEELENAVGELADPNAKFPVPYDD
ncbi:hypothetical protein [Streptomyces sp. E5N91]|uniref:hypothetical protein n=1 Tax=Streptomyces sp. E5N91 TaxID=1851996 RepID=UPI00187D34C0|nr:hypothetical protein [Streptomyces sp. E5N91]